ncbi:MAG: DNA translocase FtsK 4TM domain-containing protein [Cytophagales bacterium]|nr:DNA translocase FtsK 4TM domain-containing protein [Cytophagales bacterium]
MEEYGHENVLNSSPEISLGEGSSGEEVSEKRQTHFTLLGTGIVLLSLFIGLSSLSYLLSGTADQSLVEELLHRKGWETEVPINNWFGLVGAVIGYFLLHEGFGLGSLFFLPIFLLGGVEIFSGRQFFSLRRTIVFWSFCGLWSSLLLAFLTLEHPKPFTTLPLHGDMGREGILLLVHLIAKGCLPFLIVILLVFLVYYYKLFHWVPKFKALFQRRFQASLPEASIQAENPSSYTPLSEENPSPSQTPSNDPEEETIQRLIRETQAAVAKETQMKAEKKPSIPSHPPISSSQSSSTRQSYHPPHSNLLQNPPSTSSTPSPTELEQKKERIKQILKDFRVHLVEEEDIKCTIGPTVTLYEVIPEAGTKVSRIQGLEDDIALGLAAKGIRIIAPVPGKGTIGIEVPNARRDFISLRSVIDQPAFTKTEAELPIILGKDISNQIIVSDLAQMPHLLIAGATGQGKSVGLNTLLISLLFKKLPHQLKLVLIDPKKVELSLFEEIENQFLAKIPEEEHAIITDPQKAVYTLDALCKEMDARYDQLKEAGCRNLMEYNQKILANQGSSPHDVLPYIVLVIDELADLMMTAGKEVEKYIARLAQLARAIGIHLVLATQRPSVNVITGLIKANFPTRLSYKVSSQIDSRVILDAPGADRLLGKGDLLFDKNGELIRLQCPYVATEEVEDVCSFIGEQFSPEDPYTLPKPDIKQDGNPLAFKKGDRDAQIEEAARILFELKRGSASLLQRKMGMGFGRAARVIDQLEQLGILGPIKGSKPRELLVSSLEELQNILNEDR